MPTPRAKNSWYKFINAAKGKPASIIIDGEIGGWGVTSSSFRNDFARLGENEAVNLHIMSGGGSILDGQEIANIIRKHKGEVNVTLGSICASIATVIACAGTKVTASKNTIYMIHRASAWCAGDADDMRKTAEIMEKLEKGIIDAYADKTGLDREDLAAMLDEETWLDAEEAKEQGFVDEISEDEAEDDVKDNVDLSHYKNISKLISTAANEIASAIAGNGKGVNLLALKNSVSKTAAVSPPSNSPNNPQNNSVPTQMTDEEKKAQQAEIEAKANAKALELVKAQNERAKEIRATVEAIKKRDKKDFSELADEYLNDSSKSLADFFKAISTSDKYKATEVVGSGIELIEPLDAYKGTIGFQVVNSEQFKAVGDLVKRQGRRPQGGINLQIELDSFRNAVLTSTATSGSGLTSIEKLPGVVELGVRPLMVEDLIAAGQTDNTTIRYIQEVTYTEGATTVGETGALPELPMTYQEIDASVKDIGGYVKMSENLMADYPAVASFINQRLPYQVDRAVDDQLLNGDGLGTNITGLLATSGFQTLALGTNSRPDLALKLQTLVRWQNMTAGQAQGGFEPDAYIVHPTDWETLMLTKDANGQYICRGPFVGGYGNPSQFGAIGSIVEFYTLWGKKVAISPATAQGTIVCAAFKMGAQKFDRQGLIIDMTNSDSSDFLSRKITVRGTRRLALAIYRPGCFVTGTGV